MLPVFRKIRYRLAKNNQFLKYSRYAIGEIALIVIGILIALQINNWNEEQKQESFNNKLLVDIRNTSMNIRNTLNWGIDYNLEGMASAELILIHLKEDLPYHDSLDVHFSRAIQYAASNVKNSDYESLWDYRLNALDNEDIVKAITDVYNYVMWVEILANRQEAYYMNTVYPVLTQSEMFESVTIKSKMKPIDLDQLKDSKKYFIILNTLIEDRKLRNKEYRALIQKLLDLEKIIDEQK